MPNESVPVAGEAMPANLSRRFFLSRMGGVAAASALAAAPVAAASGPEENPELLRLGARFEAAHADYFATSERVSELQPVFRAMAPTIPPEIVGSEFDRFNGWGYGDIYRDPASPKVEDMKGADGRRMLVISSHALERHFKGEKMPKGIERLYRLAFDFEGATDAALQSSGLATALQEHHNADGTLRRVIYDMSQTRARTPAGLGIKVRATAAYAALGADERFSASLWLAKSMWGDLEEGEVL
ncbi:hypothetical protein [Shinella granuli]|uniref:Uncharacterized protein n=1 Tax=Shinella granuli TaxID=323621 RepID=A0A4R2C3Z1_SHIGR|nr:hypothetical protein [Shinella granuli]TCN34941.1 hypothetical protein EV665_13120 [Shinella granuli]